MPHNIIATLIKLLVASLVVGLVLSALDVTPWQMFEDLGGSVREVVNAGREFFTWALRYILLGAVVVVPIWLVIVAVNLIRRR